MKTTNFALLIFCFVLPFFAHGQQAAPATVRTLPKADLWDQQKGELENIKYHNFRFQVALEEGDQQSMEDLFAKICQLMAAELDQIKAKQLVSPLGQDAQQRFDSQAAKLEKANQSLVTDGKAAQALKAFQDFVSLMEEELAELEGKVD